MTCNFKSNTFAINTKNEGDTLIGFDYLYTNSIFHQECKMQFLLKSGENTEFVNFDINRAGDESILETKIYF